MSVGAHIVAPHEYVPAIAQFLKGLVHLPLYERRGTAGAGAEIDEGVVGDGGAEDGLERAGDEGGGGCGLEDWGFVGPEESETGLDEGAKRSGEPGIGFLVLAFLFLRRMGWDGMRWKLGTRTGRRFRKDEAGEWVEGEPWLGPRRSGRGESML